MGEITPTEEDYEKYDLTKSGKINTVDWLMISRIVNGLETGNAQFILNTNEAENALIIKNDKEKVETNIGRFGSYINRLKTGTLTATNVHTDSFVIEKDDNWYVFIGKAGYNDIDTSEIALYKNDGVPSICMYGEFGRIEAECFQVNNAGYAMHGKNTDHIYQCHWTGSQLQFWVDATNVGTLSDKRLKTDIKQIDEDSTVLDIGCANGLLGSLIKKFKGCTIDGIEYDKEAAKVAYSRKIYEDVYVFSILDFRNFKKLLKTKRYDYIIFGDVLEHLSEPWDAIANVTKLLNENGKIIIYNENAYKSEVIDETTFSGLEDNYSLYKKQDKQTYVKTRFITPGFSNDDAGYESYCKSETTGDIIINEVMVSNDWYLKQSDNKFYDWVEIKNSSDKIINLSEYVITDKKSKMKYELPSVQLKPGQLYVLICSAKTTQDSTGYYHTGFALNATSENLYIFKKDGTLVDYAYLAQIPYGGTYGRMNGQNGYYFFTKATPGSENTSGVRQISAPPLSNYQPGVYNVPSMDVSFESDGVIYYTTDGTEPTKKSAVYSKPININSNTIENE